MSFDDKVVIVTGAAQSIGKAAAVEFAKQGAVVYCLDLQSSVSETANLITAEGGRAEFQRLDVTDQAGWYDLLERVRSERSKLDILVNCAGFVQKGSIEDTSYEEFQRSFDVNVGGVFKSMRAAVPLMRVRSKEQGLATIINLSSMAAFNGMPMYSAYGASKAAVWSLTRTAALEFARLKYPVRVNAIHPATIDTEMTRAVMRMSIQSGEDEETIVQQMIAQHPSGRLGSVEDVVFAIMYLADERSSFTTGFSLTVAGGRGAGEW